MVGQPFSRFRVGSPRAVRAPSTDAAGLITFYESQGDRNVACADLIQAAAAATANRPE